MPSSHDMNWPRGTDTEVDLDVSFNMNAYLAKISYWRSLPCCLDLVLQGQPGIVFFPRQPFY